MQQNIKVYMLTLALWLLLAGPVLAQGDHHGNHHGDAPLTAEGQGVLHAIDKDAARVTLEHAPIPDLRWPAMTMDLPLRSAGLASDLEPGDAVLFTLEQVGETDYEIIELRRLD